MAGPLPQLRVLVLSPGGLRLPLNQTHSHSQVLSRRFVQKQQMDHRVKDAPSPTSRSSQDHALDRLQSHLAYRLHAFILWDCISSLTTKSSQKIPSYIHTQACNMHHTHLCGVLMCIWVYVYACVPMSISVCACMYAYTVCVHMFVQLCERPEESVT